MTGNGLAVVHDADAVPDAVMHALARETKLSETSFLQSADAGGADYRHRIWMPSGEIPFAGHPSLGAAAAVAHARDERRATYVQQTEAGLQPVEVEMDGRLARVSMLQEPARFGPELDPDEVLQTVGLDGDDADPALPAQVVSTGVEQMLVQLRSAAALSGLLPDYDRIGALLRSYGAIVLYVSAVDLEAGTAHARAFTGSAAIGEDPATGSAAGPLCAYLAERGLAHRIEITQGVEMRRPSRLVAEMHNGRPRVGGDVVQVIEGEVQL
jgi:trans-2,3-dihydro-3-hydroxyanthranilate isomerase